jgi:GWxTD domain-containing protein
MRTDLTIILLALVLGSCVTPKSTTDNSHRGLYDYESVVLHPSISVYHISDSETEIHYSFEASELLFNRSHVDSSFKAHLSFKGELFQNIADSLSLAHEFQSDRQFVNQNTHHIQGSISIPCDQGTESTLNISFEDKNRKTVARAIISIDKSNRFSSQNFLVLDKDDNVVSGDQIAGNSELTLRCDRCSDSEFSISRNDAEIKLPPPPFSDSRIELPSHKDGLNMSLPAEDNELEINVTSGFYFITQDPSNKDGLTLSVRDEFFPDIMKVDDMIASLRYITSRAEFEGMTDGGRTREVMESFWIECGGSKEKARQLIQAYYNRVREANMYFSHVVPGWKTDRGLIHIVFGNPKKIFHYPEKEIWLYGEEDNLNSLQFTFRNRTSQYSSNHLVLQRDHIYKSNWERAVTSWRNGRIYED